MGLLPLSAIESLLACPRCGSSLGRNASVYECTNDECRSASDTPYSVIDGHPVLVDFDTSTLSAEELHSSNGASLVPRRSYRSALARAYRWSFSKARVSARNISRLCESLNTTSKTPTVLVIGGGTIGAGCEILYQHPAIRIIAFDIYSSSHTQFIADAHRIPMVSTSVDAVIVQAVLEHVLNPVTVVREIERVLVPNGYVYSEIPFMQQVHEGAHDFTRYTLSGHRFLFASFATVTLGIIGGTGTSALWMVEHVARGLFRSNYAGHLAKIAFSWLQVLDGIVPQRYSVDNACCTYFVGRLGAPCQDTITGVYNLVTTGGQAAARASNCSALPLSGARPTGWRQP